MSEIRLRNLSSLTTKPTKNDKIWNEHTRPLCKRTSKNDLKVLEKQVKCYGKAIRMEEEHVLTHILVAFLYRLNGHRSN